MSEIITMEMIREQATLLSSRKYGGMVSFIGGGNRRKPPNCRKSLTNFIT
jgi:hypothetical protein